MKPQVAFSFNRRPRDEAAPLERTLACMIGQKRVKKQFRRQSYYEAFCNISGTIAKASPHMGQFVEPMSLHEL
jgi:hypothetical protein